MENPGKYDVWFMFRTWRRLQPVRFLSGERDFFIRVTSAGDVTDVEVLLDNEEPDGLFGEILF